MNVQRLEMVRGLWRAHTMLPRCFGVARLVSGVVGCDGDIPPRKAAPPAVATGTGADYSIKGFYIKGDKRHPVKFGPSTVAPPELAEPLVPEAKRTQAIAPPPVR